MTKEQSNMILADIISLYAPKFGRTFTKQVAMKLATSSVETRLESIPGDAYEMAKSAFSKCGTIFDENTVDSIITGVLMSGAANMNPAFVLIWIECGSIYIKVTAKEGLIKQHTAERAIEVFKSAFADVENK